MKDSIFCEETNQGMTRGMRKGDHIVNNDALKALEDLVTATCPIKLRYSCNVLKMDNINGFTFVECLGGIMISSSSAARNLEGMKKLVGLVDLTNIKPFVDEMTKVPDKYADFTKSTDLPVRGAILLPGHNVLKSLVDRWKLVDILGKFPYTYMKPHPVTDDVVVKELTTLGPILPQDVSAFQLISDPNIKIYTSASSTLAFQAKLLGKEVFSIDSAGSPYLPPYAHYTSLTMSDWGVCPDPQLLKAVLSDPRSGFFYPGYTTKEDLQQYFDYMLSL